MNIFPAHHYLLINRLIHCKTKQVGRQQGGELSLLKRRLAVYMKSRTVKAALTGRDLQAMGLQPGPRYKTILEKLLDARLDGTVITEAEERALVRKWLTG